MTGEISLLHPDWWNMHQGRVWEAQDRSEPGNYEICLIDHRGSNIIIKHISEYVPTPDEDGTLEWQVRWSARQRVRSETYLNDVVAGQKLWTQEELLAAFCFHSLKLNDREARVADLHHSGPLCIGKFIRRGKYLNIPGPGMAHPDDTNLSILLDDRLTDTLRKFIQAKPKLRLRVVSGSKR